MCDLDGISSKYLTTKNQASFSKEKSKHLTQQFWTYLQLEMDRSLSSSSEVQEFWGPGILEALRTILQFIENFTSVLGKLLSPLSQRWIRVV